MRHVERFQQLIATRTGLWFDEGKLPFLAEVLEKRLAAAGASVERYLAGLETGGLAELRELARELTVGETYFFRHAEQFRAFTEVALPARIAARGAAGRISVLSAGCSSGDEAYSLAILLKERGLELGTGATVLGHDLNPAALDRASRGRYSDWALRETPRELRERWFSREGNTWVLAPAIRNGVDFRELNLGSGESALLGAERFDVIFCRNLMMYFEPGHAQRLVDALALALVPGGFLFLGHAETLRGLSNDFHLRHTHDTFYYQRKEQLQAPAAPSQLPQTHPTAALASTDWAQTWVETVQRSSERIRALSEGDHVPASRRASAAPRDLAPVLALLEAERFAEALSALPAADDDSEVMLLRAVLLTHGGKFAEARAACARLLELDGLNAGAHYLLALCAEGEQRLGTAVDHDQTAAYLDPGFAMPRLHLGLMARRAGDREAAHRDLSDALHLLQREEPSRVVLFGGGFRREALIALCRAELNGLDGSST
jgi:chemotaxis protein methyltransferase CheR